MSKKSEDSRPTTNGAPRADASAHGAEGPHGIATSNATVTSNADVATSDDAQGASPSGESKPQVVDLKAMFEEAEALGETIRTKEREIKDAQEKLSATIKGIFDATGKKGPFNWRGRQLTLVSRKSKGQDHENWYLRGPSDRDAIDVG